MPTISSGYIASPNKTNAKSEAQNELVYRHTIMRHIGAKAQAIFVVRNIKLPKNKLPNKGIFLATGNSFKGFVFVRRHQMSDTMKEKVHLTRFSSAGWNPSRAMTR